MTQTITLEDVLTAGRKAYEEKRLSAQGPTPACSYRDESGCPCVVGAAMTDETVEKVQFQGNDGSRVHQLNTKNLIHIPQEDLVAVGDIQNLHDEWTRAVRMTQLGVVTEEQRLTAERNCEVAEQRFVNALYR